MQEMERMPTLTKETKKKRKSSRILIGLGWIFFLILSMMMFLQSSLSKIDEIIVNGVQIIDTNEIVQLSEIQKGQSFFTVQTSKIENRIKNLSEVKAVDVTRSFPGKVTITVTEFEHVAFHWVDQKLLIPILENGTRLENRPWNDRVIDRPILRNWKDETQFFQLGEELKKLDSSIRNEISEIEPDINEKDPLRMVLYMKNGYEVHTSLRHFAKNMAWYPPFITNLKHEGSPKGIIMLLDGKWFIPYTDSDMEKGV